MRNKMQFHELTGGEYGRKIAYTDVEKITVDNDVKDIGD